MIVKRMAVTFLMMIMTTQAASASGIPVFDAASAANFITQIQELQKQLEVAKDQVAQAEAAYESQTGNRGFGSIFNNPEIRQYLPPDVRTIYDIAGSTGHNGLDSIIEAIADEYDIPANTQEAVTEIEQRERSAGATNRAMAEQAYQGTEQRLVQIDRLRQAISDTEDPKEIAELQARIATENAAITAESSRMELMRLNAQAEQQLIEQQKAELNRRYMSSDNTEMPGIN